MIIPKLAGFTALSAIHHSTTHTLIEKFMALHSTTVGLSIRNLNSGIWQK
jgi:hypothetical protein